MAEGEQWQPSSRVTVTLNAPGLSYDPGDTIKGVHIDGVTGEAESLTVRTDEDRNLVFTAGSFSSFIFYVDFHYNGTFSIEGESSITLSELFAQLGIEKDAADAVRVTFSDPTLIDIGRLENDWLLTSLLPFDTEEALIIEFSDGDILRLLVTDAQIPASSGYWKKVDSISDAGDNATYVIIGIYNNDNRAVVRNNTSTSNTAVAMTGVQNHSGYYTTTTAITDQMQMHFSSAVGTEGSTQIYTFDGTTKYYLTVGNSSASFSTTQASYTLANRSDYSNNWRISNNNGYFLRHNNGWSSSNSTNTSYTPMRNLAIYKYYLDTVNNSGSFTVPVYTVKVDKNGTAVSEAVYQKSVTVSGTSGTTTVADLFENYDVEGDYAGAYFGTEYTKGTENVVSLARGGSSGANRRVRVTTESSSTADYNTGVNALYLMYTEQAEELTGGTYWQKLSSLDNIESGETYMIVSGGSGYALGVSGSSVSAAAANMTKVQGNYYTTTLGEQYRWTLTGSGSTFTALNDNSQRYIRLNSSIIGDSSRSLTLSYYDTDDYWTVYGNTRYLVYNGSDFDRSTSVSDSAHMDIYRMVTVTDPGGGDDPGEDPTEPPKVQPTYPNDSTLTGGAVSDAKTGTLDNTAVKTVVSDAGSKVIGSYASDPSSARIEDRFFSVPQGTKYPSINDGKLTTDKSVIYGTDDYGAFSSYDADEFSVTLSALAQDYLIEEMANVQVPVDVVFIPDASGSMSNNVSSGTTRRDAVVSAVNSSIEEIMDNNPLKRVGVAVFSRGGNVILPLNHYNKSSSGDYIYLSSNDITSRTLTITGTSRTAGGTNGATGGYSQQGGTYTQYGIALGAKMLTDETETTTTEYVTILKGTEDETTVEIDVPHQPVMILLSDGDPTLCTSSYNNVLGSGVTHYGSGVYPSTSNNKGVHGYYTILSANYYKQAVSAHYNAATAFYTIGMGIYPDTDANKYKDMGAVLFTGSATGDAYKRAVLNPTPAAVSDLISNGARTTDPNEDFTAAQTWSNSAQMLNQLLNNSYTGSTVTVGTRNTYTQIGTTSESVPVIRNPYTDYSYADSASFGNLNATQLAEIFSGIVNANLRVKDHGFVLKKNSDLEINDVIGYGMEIKGDPVLRYNGVNFKTFTKNVSGNVTTYTFTGTASTSDGSGFTGGERVVSMSTITATVTKNSDGTQSVKLTVPESSVPSLTPQIVAGHDKLWYYEELPVRLIYQVGLNSAAKEEIAELDKGETTTYYTNAFTKNASDAIIPSANSTATPSINNPYNNPPSGETWSGESHEYGDDDHIEGQYSPHEHMKTSNPTGTAAYSGSSTGLSREMEDGSEKAGQVTVALGNNGMLTFTNTDTLDPSEKVPDHYKRIDAFRDGVDNPDTDLDNKDYLDMTDLYRLYLDVGPESAYAAVDVLFILDRSSSMSNFSTADKDATDILGRTGLWRRTALNSMMNGLDPNKSYTGTSGNYPTDNNGGNYTTLEGNGLIAMINGLNSANQIAVGTFYKIPADSLGWGPATRPVTDNVGATGTNYMAGLYEARQLLKQVEGDGKRKVMIFLSDGEPTEYYITDPTTDAEWRNMTSSNISGVQDANSRRAGTPINLRTNEHIDAFLKDYSTKNGNTDYIEPVDIYTIAVGYTPDQSLNYLGRLSSSGSVIVDTNFQTILGQLDEYITQGVGHYTHLVIDDYLSEDVDFYTDDLDLLVQRVSTNDPTDVATLYSNGTYYPVNGENILAQNGVSWDAETGHVRVEFGPEYKEVGGYIYRVSFNVKATQTAYDKYADNLAEHGNGYYSATASNDTITGDSDTDFTDRYNHKNATSSNKPGFRSNDTATLTYEQSHYGETPVKQDPVPYKDPVIQVGVKDYTVTKSWYDGNNNHEDDSVTIYLHSMSSSGVDRVMGQVTLDKSNNWTHTFKDLPKGYVYSVVEDPVKTGFIPIYQYSSDTTAVTVINTPSTADITLQKVGVDLSPIPEAGVTFKIYTDSSRSSDSLFGTYVTDSSGVCTVSDIERDKEYWVVETVAPYGYLVMPQAHSFTLTSTGLETGEYQDHYLIPDSGTTLLVRNYTGTKMPSTGGSTPRQLRSLGAASLVTALWLLLLKGVWYILGKRRKRS